MTYNGSAIEVLEGLEPVRLRPAMYIGDTDKAGFHHLIWEIVDNSVDEALNGHATHVIIDVTDDPPTATIRDNGRGIPFDKHPKVGKPTAEVILTTLHAGGKFKGEAYNFSGGLHGVGSSVVCALSAYLFLRVVRDGQVYEQTFRRGKPERPKITRAAGSDARGTTTIFQPDEEIFGKQIFDLLLVRERIRAKAYLNPGVVFVLNGEEFCYQGGLSDLVAARLIEGELEIVGAPFEYVTEDMQITLAWTTDPHDDLVSSFANGIPTRDGGTHVAGLRAAVADAVRECMAEQGWLPRRPQIEPEDTREGLLGAIHVLVRDPQFQGQTKDRLNNPNVRSRVQAELKRVLSEWLVLNSSTASKIAERVIEAAKARTASRTADFEVRRKDPVSVLSVQLPGKLADCSSRSVSDTELFIVEGDSAGGSAKQARDRKTQAIFALRGKVLNIMAEENLERVLENVELADLITALGCGIGPAFDLDKLRYGRVIVMSDADVDGHHIATLLLGFFYRAMPGIIDAGRLFLAKPPLFRVEISGQDVIWALDQEELDLAVRSTRKPVEITRFKGLGEMPPAALYATTMDPRYRRLDQVLIPEGTEIETAAVLSDLLGASAALRMPYITEFNPDMIEEV